ncbi:MAG TPA: hypothetical protein VL219_07655 [Steroidobacteraceae bacterium]|nr:hypothetical protein [Steroidobacteraceae bacterium]
MKRLLSALLVAAGLLAGAAPALACVTALQADCCPHGLPCGDGAGSAAVCCAAPALLPGVVSSTLRTGFDAQPDSGSLPAGPVAAWSLNPARTADAGHIDIAGERPLARQSRPIYLRTSRLRL